jgi:hypothetical protein
MELESQWKLLRMCMSIHAQTGNLYYNALNVFHECGITLKAELRFARNKHRDLILFITAASYLKRETNCEGGRTDRGDERLRTLN